MAGLQFPFSELVRETAALKAIAIAFLDPSTTWVLDVLKSNFESLWSASADRSSSLELQPLKTKTSNGYERGPRRGAQAIVAQITGTWEVRPLGTNSKKPKLRQKRLLELCGIASTKIELLDLESKRVAMWRVELGAEDSPGCYFHVQVLGDRKHPPFPRAIPIPRLPSLFVTPMGVVEYVIGELFQDQGSKAAMGNSGELPHWRELQRKRLQRLFDWQQNLLADVDSSPWMTLKEAQPEGDLFL